MAGVPKTSGQGTSRYSYQHAYSQGMRGTGAPAAKGVAALRTDKSLTPTGKSASGGKVKVDAGAPMNISYGDTWGETWEHAKGKGAKAKKGVKL